MIPNPAFAREMVIVEWTNRQIGNVTFEGTAREVFRMQVRPTAVARAERYGGYGTRQAPA